MVSRHGTFRARLEATDAGRHSVVVRFHDPDSAPVSWRSTTEVTRMPPPLYEGSSGPYVLLLEHRLAELHYRVAGQDPSFDYRDADSVLAFHKAQGMERTTGVDEATWRALSSPKIPQPRDHSPGKHFEIDLAKQVLYYVEDGTITGILHISSGKPSTPTYPGRFHVWSKQPGTNSDGMYNSSFFDGNRALHGYPDVPAYAASHGCVRIPEWNALWVYDRAPIGIEVLVYG